MDDFVQFVVMVVILALVAVLTWVRKVIEKMAREREGGPPVDVGKAVRAQLQKYMRAAGQHLDPMGRPAAGVIVDAAGRPVEAEPPARPAKELVRPPEEAVRPAREAPAPLVLEKRAAPRPRPVPRPPRKAVRPLLGRRDIPHAILTAELLGPPLALREDYRLF